MRLGRACRARGDHQRGKESWGQLSIWGLVDHSTASYNPIVPQRDTEWPLMDEEEFMGQEAGKLRSVPRE